MSKNPYSKSSKKNPYKNSKNAYNGNGNYKGKSTLFESKDKNVYSSTNSSKSVYEKDVDNTYTY